MKRRMYLSGIATGLAGLSGCMASGANPFNGGSDQLRLDTVDISVPDSSELAISSSITQPNIDSEQTAQFELAVEWQGEESQKLAFGNRIPFSYPNYSSDSEGIVLLPVDLEMESATKGKWVPKTDETGHIPSQSNLITSDLSSGESVTESWEVWAAPEVADQIQPGSYKFENQISLYSDTSDETKEVAWTLTIEIGQLD